MVRSILAPFLAQRVKSESAQRVMYKHQIATYHLAKNPNLHPEIWYALANIKNDQTITAALAEGSTNVEPERLKLLLADSRAYVSENVFKYALGNIPEELFTELLHARRINKKTATAWLSRGNIPSYAVKHVAMVEGGLLQIKALANSQVYTEAEAIAVLRSLDLSIPAKRGGRSGQPPFVNEIARLLDLRPALIPFALDSQNEAITHALSVSRHIFTDEHFAKLIEGFMKITKGSSIRDYYDTQPALHIISHPNSSLDISKHASSSLIVKTWGLPHSKLSFGRDTESMAKDRLARKRANYPDGPLTQDWSLLTDPDRAKAERAFTDEGKEAELYPSLHLPAANAAPTPLAELPVTDYPKTHKLTQQQIDEEITPVIDLLGEDGWSTFLALSVDWDGSVLELIQMTQGLVPRELKTT